MKHRNPLMLGLFFLLAALLAVEPVLAQRDNSKPRPSPNAGVSQTIGTTEVALTYGRPGVKGREVFGKMLPYGTVWRAGANEPTSITFSSDVKVEGQPLAAGTYAFWIVPREKGNWDVIFGKMVRWGTMYEQSNDVLSVSVAPKKGPHQEWVSYTFEDLSDNTATLHAHWAETIVPVKISVGGS